MKDFFFGALSLVIALVVVALLGEAVIRGSNLFSETVRDDRSRRGLVLDSEFGWLPAPNYSYVGEFKDSSGTSYPVDIQTDTRGFRAYGNPNEAHKTKVLFIGDSFTHAMQVGNDKTYYGLLSKSLDLETFALGVEGYGTLQ